MKPTDSSAFHMPNFDAEPQAPGSRRACKRIVVERGTPESEQERVVDAAFEARIEMMASLTRGTEVLHAIEKVRRLAGDWATIGVVLIAPDRETYDAINFCGQTEEHDGEGPAKCLQLGGWYIHLGYRTGRNALDPSHVD